MFLDNLLGGKKDSGRDAGNVFARDPRQSDKSLGDVLDALNYQGSDTAALDPIQSSRTATSEVQNNPMLASLFGKGGQLDQAAAENTRLSKEGFQLTPEDKTAYGQAAGNIAREFDAGEGNLAQALAARGMTNSGAAAQGIMSSQGNKLEMLSQLQQNIAQQRMQMNLQRMAQTRQFMTQLGAQAQEAIQGQYGRQMGSEQAHFGETMGKAGLGMNYLNAYQNQNNEQLQQRAGTEKQQGWAAGVQDLGNLGMMAGMYAFGGGAGGGAGAQPGAAQANGGTYKGLNSNGQYAYPIGPNKQ